MFVKIDDVVIKKDCIEYAHIVEDPQNVKLEIHLINQKHDTAVCTIVLKYDNRKEAEYWLNEISQIR